MEDDIEKEETSYFYEAVFLGFVGGNHLWNVKVLGYSFEVVTPFWSRTGIGGIKHKVAELLSYTKARGSSLSEESIRFIVDNSRATSPSQESVLNLLHRDAQEYGLPLKQYCKEYGIYRNY